MIPYHIHGHHAAGNDQYLYIPTMNTAEGIVFPRRLNETTVM